MTRPEAAHGPLTFRATKRCIGPAAGALMLFAVGTNVQAGWVLAIAAILLGILGAGLVLPIRALRGLEVDRRAPTTIRAGDAAEVTLEIRNTASGLRGIVRADDEFLGTASAVVPMLRPGETRAYRSRRTGARRGVWRSGPCRLVSGAPFGMLLAGRTLDVASETVVYPRVFDVSLEALVGRTDVDHRAASGDVSAVREYRPGDPLRHVHWRSTARRGELIVREFEDRGRPQVAVLAAVPHDPDSADAIAAVACSFALAALREGREPLLGCARGGRVVSQRASTSETILDWGARLAPDPTPLEAVLAATGDARAVVCVLEAGPTSRAAVTRLAGLAASGAGVGAVVVDPRPAGEPPTDAAVAAVATLRGAGAEVRLVGFTEVEACFRTPSGVR